MPISLTALTIFGCSCAYDGDRDMLGDLTLPHYSTVVPITNRYDASFLRAKLGAFKVFFFVLNDGLNILDILK